jgi:hypothetical protein
VARGPLDKIDKHQLDEHRPLPILNPKNFPGIVEGTIPRRRWNPSLDVWLASFDLLIFLNDR